MWSLCFMTSVGYVYYHVSSLNPRIKALVEQISMEKPLKYSLGLSFADQADSTPESLALGYSRSNFIYPLNQKQGPYNFINAMFNITTKLLDLSALLSHMKLACAHVLAEWIEDVLLICLYVIRICPSSETQ